MQLARVANAHQIHHANSRCQQLGDDNRSRVYQLQRGDDGDFVVGSLDACPNAVTQQIDFDLYGSLSIIRTRARRYKQFCKDACAQRGARQAVGIAGQAGLAAI